MSLCWFQALCRKDWGTPYQCMFSQPALLRCCRDGRDTRRKWVREPLLFTALKELSHIQPLPVNFNNIFPLRSSVWLVDKMLENHSTFCAGMWMAALYNLCKTQTADACVNNIFTTLLETLIHQFYGKFVWIGFWFFLLMQNWHLVIFWLTASLNNPCNGLTSTGLHSGRWDRTYKTAHPFLFI